MPTTLGDGLFSISVFVVQRERKHRQTDAHRHPPTTSFVDALWLVNKHRH